MKLIRLTLTGFLTSIICLVYLYVFEPQALYRAHRCLMAARPWYGCFLGHDLEFKTDLFGMQYDGNTRNLIDLRVLKYGAFEKYVLFFMSDVTRSTRRARTFIDIGANTGQHSMYMSRHVDEVHAFEPYGPVIDILRKRLEANKIRNIIIHPVGLGNESKKLPFYRPPETNLGIGSFVADWSSENAYFSELEIAVGDEELQKFNVRVVDLIKIDVEGYEMPVLQGLAQTLARDRPVVVFELSIHPGSPLSYNSIEDITKAFPERYGLLVFKSWDEYGGFYELADVRHIVRFDIPNQHTAVAYPLERAAQIPRKNLPK